jgi:EmrB/QacA subfamily drug resistance transporter
MSATAQVGKPPVATDQPDPRRWKALGVLLFATFMSILDGSIVNVALPSLQRDLGASYSAVQWVVAGYTLTYALGVITGGRLGDIFGRRRLFLTGVAGFTAASVLCALATSPGLLITFRVLQAALAAVMIPQVLSTIQVMFGPKERVAAFSAYGAVGGFGVVCGPVLGGALIDLNLFDWGWRWIFLVNLPIGVATLICAAILVRESVPPTRARVDPGGIALVTAGLLLLLYPLMQGRALGWPLWTYLSLVVAVPVLAFFVGYERRLSKAGRSPVIEPGLFRHRAFSGGILLGLLTMSVTVSLLFYLTIFFQIGHGFSAMRTGLTFLPLAVGIVAGSRATSKLTLLIGRNVIILGAVLAAAANAVLLLQVYGADPVNPWRLAPTMLVVGFGLSLIPPTLGTFVFSSVDIRNAGSASGVLNSVLQLGGAVGIAVVGVLFFGLLGGHATTAVTDAAPDLRATLVASGVDAPRADRLATGLAACVHDRFGENDPTVVPASCQRLAQEQQGLPDAATGVLADTTARAQRLDFGYSLRQSLGLEIVILLLCLPVVFLLPARVSLPQAPPRPASPEKAGAPGRG